MFIDFCMLQGHTSGVREVAFSPHGKFLGSSSWDRAIRLWNVEERKIKHILAHPDKDCLKIFVRDGVLVAAIGEEFQPDIRVSVWDTETGKIKHTFKCDMEGYHYDYHLLACSPDGKLVAATLVYGSSDNKRYEKTECRARGIDLWNTENGERKIQVQCSEGAWVCGISFSSNEELIIVERCDRCVQITAIGKKIGERTFNDLPSVYGSTFSPNGRIMALRAKNGIWSWNKEKDMWKCVYQIETLALPKMILSSNGTLAVINYFGHNIICKTKEQVKSRIFKGHSGSSICMAFSPDSRLLASGSKDRTIILWDVETGEKICVLKVHTDDVRHVAFSPNGEFVATASDDGMVGLWNVSQWKK